MVGGSLAVSIVSFTHILKCILKNNSLAYLPVSAVQHQPEAGTIGQATGKASKFSSVKGE
jgi:hypothetical protein